MLASSLSTFIRRYSTLSSSTTFIKSNLIINSTCYYTTSKYHGFKVHAPRDKVEVHHSKSSGAGGQNVNKVNTKVEIRFNLEKADWVPDHAKLKLKEEYSKYLNNDGDFYITSEKHREQKLNLKDCFEKLDHILTKASIIPKERLPTDIPAYATEKRLKDKHFRSKIKADRNAKINLD
eukprot:gene12753-15594_t